ncbi:MAG: diguanylate cyclase [Deltaproteobacteria bacterium]|nr:MAG: diguanylate cyclase [Deltaproteobacteria bacterium]
MTPLPAWIQRQPLARKILAPFFLLLIFLGLIATVGAVYQTRTTLTRTIDQSLYALQINIEQTLRGKENRLRSISEVLASSWRRGVDPGYVLAGLEQAGFPKGSFRLVHGRRLTDADEELRRLTAQARKSGRAKVRILSDKSGHPTILLVRALDKRPDGPVLVGREPVRTSLLASTLEALHADCYLFDLAGHFLAGSHPEAPALGLDRTVLAEIAAGKRSIRELQGRRYLIAAIPLGTSDLVLAAIGLETTGIEALAGSLAFNSTLTLLAALLVSGLFFTRWIRRQLAPVDRLLEATQRVSSGDFQVAVPTSGDDELGRLSATFNTMVRQLNSLYQEKVAHERELAVHAQEKHYKDILQAKNAEIERINKELRQRLKEMSTLMDLNTAMTSSLDLDILFERMLSSVIEQFSCDRVVLFTYNHGSEELVVRNVHGIDRDLLRDVTFRMGEGVTGKAAMTQQITYVPDLQKDEETLGYKGRHQSRGSMVAIPLVVKGRLVGVLNLHKIETGAFDEGELRLLQAIANQAAISIDNSQLFEKARDLSNTDELTGLANRRHFQLILRREAAQAQRFHSHFSLIMADIDHFKTYNDTHGHLKGDIVLKRVADVMLQNTRGIDLVGRFGGEEFVILLPKTDKTGAQAAAEKLRAQILGETFPGADRSQPEGRITLSLGVAEYPADSTDIYELLDLADRALYQAKEQGRNRVVAWKQVVPMNEQTA